MSELAHNIHGDPFEVPAAAVAWRVRKVMPRGAPEIVCTRGGDALVLPIDASRDELRRAIGSPGCYRLDAIDADKFLLPALQAAYAYVHPLELHPVDLDAVVVQRLPRIVGELVSGEIVVPTIAELLDRRRSEPAIRLEPMLPPLDPDTVMHFLAIQAALEPGESALTRAIAADLGPSELRAWFAELERLEVVEAVARIRMLVGTRGGAA